MVKIEEEVIIKIELTLSEAEELYTGINPTINSVCTEIKYGLGKHLEGISLTD